MKTKEFDTTQRSSSLIFEARQKTISLCTFFIYRNNRIKKKIVISTLIRWVHWIYVWLYVKMYWSEFVSHSWTRAIPIWPYTRKNIQNKKKKKIECMKINGWAFMHLFKWIFTDNLSTCLQMMLQANFFNSLIVAKQQKKK